MTHLNDPIHSRSDDLTDLYADTHQDDEQDQISHKTEVCDDEEERRSSLIAFQKMIDDAFKNQAI